MKLQMLTLLLCLTTWLCGSWGISKLTNNLPMKARGSLRVSPDKKYIVSIGTRNYLPPNLILLTNLENGLEQTIGTYQDAKDLSWSVDSKNFLYRTERYTNYNVSIYNYNLIRNETTTLIMAKAAKYSPVNNKLAYLKDSTVYIRNLDTGLDSSVFTNNAVNDIEWSQNSDKYLYLVTGVKPYQIKSLNLANLTVKEIYRSYSPEFNLTQDFPLTYNDFQFSSFIKNGEEEVLIAKANPHHGNVKDSVMIYRSASNTLEVVLEHYNDPYNTWITGFFAPKWSLDGKTFTVQYGTEQVDYGCGHTVWEYNLENDSIIDFIPGGEVSYARQYYGEFMNPVYIDANRIAFSAWDRYNLDTYQNEIHIADRRIVKILDDQINLKTVLLGNYPNPFNNSTVINYHLPKESKIDLAVYNAKGEMVKKLFSGNQSAGGHAITFDANGFNSGVYYCVMKVGNNNVVRKMIMLK